MTKPNGKRARLYAACPRCHWCGRTTAFAGMLPTEPDFATVDHLFAREHPDRNAVGSVVLACRRCNNTRGHTIPFSPPWRIEGHVPPLMLAKIAPYVVTTKASKQ